MMRLFLAIPIPDDVATKIARVQHGLEGAKWSPRENLHLTLRFLGDVDKRKAQDIDAELEQIRVSPFDLDIATIGFFGGEEPHAAWIGVKANSALMELQKQCERACRRAGLAPDPRSYTPHITICYLPRHYPVGNVMAFQQDNNLFKAQDWLADRFYLYASQTQGRGPSRYSIEAEYPLLL